MGFNGRLPKEGIITSICGEDNKVCDKCKGDKLIHVIYSPHDEEYVDCPECVDKKRKDN